MRAGRARAGRRRRLRRAHRCRRSETCHAHCVAWSRAWFGGCARLGAWTPARTSGCVGLVAWIPVPGSAVRVASAVGRTQGGANAAWGPSRARGFGCWPGAGWGKCRATGTSARLLVQMYQSRPEWAVCTAPSRRSCRGDPSTAPATGDLSIYMRRIRLPAVRPKHWPCGHPARKGRGRRLGRAPTVGYRGRRGQALASSTSATAAYDFASA